MSSVVSSTARGWFFAGCVVAAHVVVHAADWPQWRGPALNGTSPETGLPTRWDVKTNVTWKLRLPSWSGSTPIVWDGHIFLNVADRGALSLWAVDRSSGALLWQRPLGGGDRRERKQNMSSPSPVTDGGRVWIMTGTGRLAAFDFSGKELWTRDIQKDYGRFGLNWGYASSPLLYDGDLYLQVLHGMRTSDPSYVMKIDGASGKTLWRVLRPTSAVRESPDAYSTPALIRRGTAAAGTAAEIVISGGDVLTGHDPESGKEIWRANGLNPNNDGAHRIVASPVVFGDMVYASGREQPLLAFSIGGRGDITRSHRVWSSNTAPDVPTPVTDGTYFYVVRDNGVLWCLDAKTGARIYGPQRLRPGTYSSSPVLADGKLYVSNEDGVTSVVKAGAQFELVAENRLDDYVLSSPAVSDGQVFLRTAEYLWAIGQRRLSSPR